MIYGSKIVLTTTYAQGLGFDTTYMRKTIQGVSPELVVIDVEFLEPSYLNTIIRHGFTTDIIYSESQILALMQTADWYTEE
jgi:hypothetical protein